MIGIIGGTGIYQLEGLTLLEELRPATPFGEPSGPLMKGRVGNQDVIFLPRHGERHQFLPHEVNYRANIFALKQAGVTRIIGLSAVGSLQLELKPGEFAVPNQYFDHTAGQRRKTFFGQGMAAHVSTAEPTCPNLTQVLIDVGSEKGHTIHSGKTYACVEGPRLGTKAESHFLKHAVKADLVGMTNVPEVFLAREAQMCYATLTIITDYDCWLEDPDLHVSVEKIFEWYSASVAKVKAMLSTLLSRPLLTKSCSCRTSLAGALLTPVSDLSEENRTIYKVLNS
ncbi:MAG: S-methyl-5'-thioadenosine phosphorylase [Fidelibacterota bacterium]